jgi:hypothetical protein
MRRGLALIWLLLSVGPAFAQDADLSALARYGNACEKLVGAIILLDTRYGADRTLVIDWISECNGNFRACRNARDAIHAIHAERTASPLDCLGHVQSREAAETAYSFYLAAVPELPRCIARRC